VLGCYIRAANKNLPEWGFKQIEVSCEKENNPDDPYTYWNVESHGTTAVRHSRTRLAESRTDWSEPPVPPGDTKYYRSPFLRDFWHLNVAMMTSNNALIPDPDKEDILASAPLDWPLMRLGLRMCGWGDQQTKYYLIGTPIIWWGATASLLIGIARVWGVRVSHAEAVRRHGAECVDFLSPMRAIADCAIMHTGEWEHFLYVGKVTFFGWALHYCEYLVRPYCTR
jgi:dolichyl-phosphate-mannose-protein mannosyltransferase